MASSSDSSMACTRERRAVRIKSNDPAPSLSDYYPTRWSRLEKRQLLEALHKHGQFDIAKISKEIPTKHITQVHSYINILRRKAEYFCIDSSCQKNLESWREIFKNIAPSNITLDDFCVIWFPFLLISMYEDFPDEGKCKINFKEAYEYIFCLLCDLPLPEISINTRHFVEISMTSMEEMVLQNSEGIIDILKDSEGMVEQNLSKTENVGNLPGMNNLEIQNISDSIKIEEISNDSECLEQVGDLPDDNEDFHEKNLEDLPANEVSNGGNLQDKNECIQEETLADEILGVHERDLPCGSEGKRDDNLDKIVLFQGVLLNPLNFPLLSLDVNETCENVCTRLLDKLNE